MKNHIYIFSCSQKLVFVYSGQFYTPFRRVRMRLWRQCLIVKMWYFLLWLQETNGCAGADIWMLIFMRCWVYRSISHQPSTGMMQKCEGLRVVFTLFSSVNIRSFCQELMDFSCVGSLEFSARHINNSEKISSNLSLFRRDDVMLNLMFRRPDVDMI